MTETQRKRLEANRHKLIEVAIEETDPDGWIDAEKAAGEAAALAEEGQVKEAAKVLASWKGERYWEKKNANQTIALIARLDQLLEGHGEQDAAAAAEEKKAIAAAEREVKKRLARSRPQLAVHTGGRK